MEFYDPVKYIIDHNMTYYGRRKVLDIMTEASGKRQVYANISNYFYKNILKKNMMPYLDKYTASKGNIEHHKGYNEMLTSLQYLKSDAHMDVSKNATIVEDAVLNIKARKKAFELSFVKDSQLGKLMYAALLKACVATTSILIGNSAVAIGNVQLKTIKTPLSIEGLSLFNKYCKDGTVDKMLRYDLNVGGAVKEAGILDAVGDAINLGVSVASAFITAIRSLVYWVYYTRIDLADYLEQQAAYVELNRKALESRKDLDPEKKKQIIAKQKEWELRLLKLSDRIQVDDVKAARKAKADAEKEAKQMRTSDATGNSADDDEGQDVPDFF